ncbi:type IV toxin-antitoxin system AbiEi family antitoxin [Kineococcus indalonis]|uniref:type IV toxin-antitoxin system AbiEi family antitoxin n=1 Tax=Kineococcus indalonis TaxID=2696566 RepID=UPI0014132F57|nr:type IV toxin-antitoxin system AbiEi family antitoxin [Kineococcus indalonis]NAZ86229.1 hypothetical protein [Kineococcus indalonis]
MTGTSEGTLPAVAEQLRTLGVDVRTAPRTRAATARTWRLSTPAGARHDYAVQEHSSLTPAAAATVGRGAEEPLLVVAPHVSDAAGDVLRHRGVHFADTAGNAYLRWPDLLVDVRGRRRPRPAATAPPAHALRAFSPRGQRVTFSLLCEPASVDAPYRVIAERSGASLGTVQAVLAELRTQGHVEVDGTGRRLHRTRALLDRWVEAYAVRTAPGLVRARFDAPDPQWWRSADEDLRADGALWGGETAAHLLDPYLRPAAAVLYARRVPRRTVVAHRLRKAEGAGGVEVRELFWNWPATGGHPVAPTPLVYADLVASADPRCLDAAERLRRDDALLRDLDRS